MEEKDKVVDTTTNSPASESKGNDTTVANGDKKPEDDKIDYKAELEKAQAQLKKAEFTIEKVKKEKSESNTKKDEDKEESNDVDEIDIEEKASSIAKSEIEKFKLEQTEDILADTIAKIATSPEHAELIRLTYQNRINKSGFNRSAILEDVSAAALLVEKPRFERQIKEMAQAVVSAKTTNTSGNVSSAKTETPDESIELSAADRKIMQKFGLSEKDLTK